MAQVAVWVPDLLFGSQVLGMLAGHEARLVDGAPAIVGADLAIVDLTVDPSTRVAALAGLADRPPTLAFYAHVEPEVRAAAAQAGLELVVPRSRMHREGPELIARLLG